LGTYGENDYGMSDIIKKKKGKTKTKVGTGCNGLYKNNCHRSRASGVGIWLRTKRHLEWLSWKQSSGTGY